MKIVLQRVASANVTVDNQTVGAIDRGIVLLTSLTATDSNQVIDEAIKKILNTAVFKNKLGKITKSITDVNGSILVISQFTLHANFKKGKLPSFSRAAEPKTANKLYNQFVSKLKDSKLKVESGNFGANMQVSLINDGPVTYILEVEENA